MRVAMLPKMVVYIHYTLPYVLSLPYIPAFSKLTVAERSDTPSEPVSPASEERCRNGGDQIGPQEMGHDLESYELQGTKGLNGNDGTTVSNELDVTMVVNEMDETTVSDEVGGITGLNGASMV